MNKYSKKNLAKMMWYKCPVCGQKLFQINENTEAHEIKFKCKSCKQIIDIDIEPMSLTR